MAETPISLPVIHIFIASPGDVADERDLAAAIIEHDLAKRPDIENRAQLRAVRWDDPDRQIPMVLNQSPQQNVIDNLPRPAACQIVLGLLWAHMGTPLKEDFIKPDGGPCLSGTEWEILDALNAKSAPDILIFRRQGQPAMADSDQAVAEQMRQWGLVNQLDQTLAQHGHINRYDDLDSLKAQLTGQLAGLIARRLDQLERTPALSKAPAPFHPIEPSWQFAAMEHQKGAHGEAFRIERSPAYRGDAAAKLMSEKLGGRYQTMLDDLLKSAIRIWGENGSLQAYATCTLISLIYAYILFCSGAFIDSDNPLAAESGIDVSTLDTLSSNLILVSALATPFIMWPAGRWIGYLEKRFSIRQRRKRPASKRKAWARKYKIASAAIFPVVAAGIFLLDQVSSAIDFGGLIFAFGLVALTALPPVILLGVWGRSRKPWAPVIIFMGAFFAFAFAVSVSGAVPLAVALAGAVLAGIVLAVAVALAGAVAVALALAVAFAGIVFALALAGAVAGAVALALAVALAGALAIASLSVRPNLQRVNILAALLGGLLVWGGFGLVSGTAFFVILLLILPLANGLLDYCSWSISRWLGIKLQGDLASEAPTWTRLRNICVHIGADIILALIVFLAMAWTLGFTLEAYDLTNSAANFDLLSGDGTGYLARIFEAPFTTGLWISLMLITTLIPTLIHLAAAIGAVLPAFMLAGLHGKDLAIQLAALPATPPDDPAGQSHWEKTIWQAAKQSNSYHWRFLGGVIATLILFSLALMSGILLPFFEWAHSCAIHGVETAREFITEAQ